MYTSCPFSTLDTSDFTSLTTSVTFSGISPLRCVDISVTEDQVVERTEGFTITLATGDTAVNLTSAAANVLIMDTSGSTIAPILPVPKHDYDIGKICNFAYWK